MKHHPYHPIIYVRGFAATQGEIEDTVADPYMGFNIGSTKMRTAWSGDVKRFYFESPLVRLMSDHKYQDVFIEGSDLIAAEQADHPIPYRCIVIHRYYDEASTDFGDGETPPIEHFATGLSDLILRLKDRVCSNKKNRVSVDDFRVYLVAHSMGGLVCRAFLQNERLGSAEARSAVDKFFTYATPHNGIDMRIVRNVPGWLTFGDANNFNRTRMAQYLDLPDSQNVSLIRNFPAERVFNLVGTNPRDYNVAGGISSWAAGDASDGLVRIENATTFGRDVNGRRITSPRAFTYRSHSGRYGIVNSEEGYQNLTRFLFGNLRVDGILDIDELILPPEVQIAKKKGKSVRGSYHFEVTASIRGCQWQMSERLVRTHSAVFRTYDELFSKNSDGVRIPDRAKSPHLFSIFLDQRKSVVTSRSVSFSFDLAVLVPDYTVNGILFARRHYEGGFIYRKMVIVEAFPPESASGDWRLRYGFQESDPGKAHIDCKGSPLDENNPFAGLCFEIPIEQTSRPGIKGRLRIEARPWS